MLSAAGILWPVIMEIVARDAVEASFVCAHPEIVENGEARPTLIARMGNRHAGHPSGCGAKSDSSGYLLGCAQDGSSS